MYKSNIDRLLGDIFSPLYSLGNLYSSALGSYQCKQDGDVLYLYIPVPGYKREELRLDLDKNELRVYSAVADENSSAVGTFQKQLIDITFTVMENVDLSDIKVVLEDGVLRIMFKKLESSKKKSLTIG